MIWAVLLRARIDGALWCRHTSLSPRNRRVRPPIGSSRQLEGPADTDGTQQFPDEYEIVEATDAERAVLERAKLVNPRPEMTVVMGFREIS